MEFERLKYKMKQMQSQVVSERTSEINPQQSEKAKVKEKKGLKFELDYEKQFNDLEQIRK